MTHSEIAQLELFQGIPEGEIEWMLANGEIVNLPAGVAFIRENQPAELFYVTLLGELQVSRVINGVREVFGTTPAGVIGGEIALLTGDVQLSTATTIMDSQLLVFDPDTFRRIFTEVPKIGARIVQVASRRMGGISQMVAQREKNSALGRLSAGLAHELNNPAAAARRSVRTLRDLLPALQHYTLALKLYQMDAEQIETLLHFQDRVLARKPDVLSAMERSDREEEMGGWLIAQGIHDGDQLAPTFVGHGMSLSELRALLESMDGQMASALVHWLNAALSANALLAEIDGSTQRISSLIDAVKSYTFMDQGEMQQVDIHAGLDNTLIMLHGMLGERNIVRQFDPRLPHITGRGAEINQVWTNLLHNAINATHANGTIWLITRLENEDVMVEIADDGHGIPPDLEPLVFEPFFTTRPLGDGVGLGLYVVNRIVRGHRGAIELYSKPGHTRAIVRLPIRQGLE
jgi:signal transduction histidine kinase